MGGGCADRIFSVISQLLTLSCCCCRHPFFFDGTSCMQNFNYAEGCNPRRLYLHFLCTCCWDAKAKSWDQNKLWFVDENLQPMWADGGGPNGPHPFMPCSEKVAWPNWQLYT